MCLDMCLRFHMLKTCKSNQIWSNFYQHRIKYRFLGEKLVTWDMFSVPVPRTTSGWHSNPFVAKENLFVLCFESCDDSETRQIANRLGCHLWIWSEHAAQFGSGRGKHFNRKIRNGIPSGKAMPCLHGISDSTDGQWFVVCKSRSCQACNASNNGR